MAHITGGGIEGRSEKDYSQIVVTAEIDLSKIRGVAVI